MSQFPHQEGLLSTAATSKRRGIHVCHVVLGWPCACLQHGSFSLAPRGSLISFRVATYQAAQFDLVSRFTTQKTHLGRKPPQLDNQVLRCPFLAAFGGHVSHTRRGDNLDFHIWMETLGSLLTPSSGITQFGINLPSENIKMARLV